MTGYLDEVIAQARQWDHARPRSAQKALGWSGMAGCRAYMGYKVREDWESDETDTWRAIVGTALHEWITGVRYEACQATGLDASFEVPVSYGGVPGHADEVVWTRGEVTDYKGIALTTPIPTPSGWTTMGAVQPGDEVFGSDGRPCQVVVKSAPKQIGTYVVRFKDGASVVCDREHLWWAMRGQGVRGHLEVACIEEMAASVMSRGQVNWRVPVAGPLMLPDADLPLSPYVLGCWLGDGSLGEGRICKHPQLFAEIKREGFPAGRIPPSQQGRVVAVRTLSGLRAKLREAGVLNDKHVPAAYLRASLPQRIALVQGLMDTDGSWNKPRRRAVFTTTSKALAAAMAELLASSGEKPVTWWGKSRGSGLLVDYCHVEWTPTRFVPFRTPVKASLVSVPGPAKLARARWRTISEITAGPDVATACIAVNSRNLTYLCGPEMIPTHNTTSLASARVWDDPQVLDEKFIQVQGYAAGVLAADDGRLAAGDLLVRILVMPVNGTFADWRCYERPFDRLVADMALHRYQNVIEAVDAGEELPRDKPPWWCERFCEFFSACRGGEPPQLEEITDPELAAAIERYGLASEAESAAKQVKRELHDLIDGAAGTARGFRTYRTRGGADDLVPDDEKMARTLEDMGRMVPYRRKPGRPAHQRVVRAEKK